MEEASDDLVAAGHSYETLFVPALFEVWTQHVLSAAQLDETHHVLDVACGTGVLTRAVRSRVGEQGRVVGVDPAPGMLAVAEQLEPQVTWLQGSAEALPLPDDSFDRVVCQFGMMFFADRQRAADDMLRVLKPGGRLVLALWRSLDHNPAYAALIELLHELAGSAAADGVRLPFSLGDARQVEAHLQHSGFGELHTVALTEQGCFPGVRQMAEAELRGWLPLLGIVLEESLIQHILSEAERRLSKYVSASGEVRFPIAAHLFSGVKPPSG